VAGRSTRITATASGTAPKMRTTTKSRTPMRRSWRKATTPRRKRRKRISSEAEHRAAEEAARKGPGKNRNPPWPVADLAERAAARLARRHPAPGWGRRAADPEDHLPGVVSGPLEAPREAPDPRARSAAPVDFRAVPAPGRQAGAPVARSRVSEPQVVLAAALRVVPAQEVWARHARAEAPHALAPAREVRRNPEQRRRGENPRAGRAPKRAEARQLVLENREARARADRSARPADRSAAPAGGRAAHGNRPVSQRRDVRRRVGPELGVRPALAARAHRAHPPVEKAGAAGPGVALAGSISQLPRARHSKRGYCLVTALLPYQ
jgi:hypothetical protein